MFRPACLVLGLSLVGLSLLHTSPSEAQLRIIPEAARQVYTLMQDLPLENTYTYVEETTGRPEDNTLVQRMMLYHQQVKGRPPTNRLDWQYTLADYLDLNEPMYAQAYPGVTTLTDNPYNGDRAAIQSLTREERRQLLDMILTAYGGDPTPPKLYIPPDVALQDQPIPESNLPTPDNTIMLPTSSSADLLK